MIYKRTFLVTEDWTNYQKKFPSTDCREATPLSQPGAHASILYKKNRATFFYLYAYANDFLKKILNYNTTFTADLLIS